MHKITAISYSSTYMPFTLAQMRFSFGQMKRTWWMDGLGTRVTRLIEPEILNEPGYRQRAQSAQIKTDIEKIYSWIIE